MPPTWDAIPHDVLCPLCDYNLRGLTDPRCPECGYRFEWDEITDPKRNAHPFLFEHHPNHNIRSLFKTLWGTRLPVRFWTSLSVTQPANQFRLGVYWVITTLFAFSPWAAELIRFLVVNWQWMQPRYRGQSFLERVFDAADLDPWLLGMLWLGSVLLIWPWLTLLTLRVFRDSMQQKRIKDIHVVRCIVYSFDLTAWLGAMIAIGTLADIKIEAGPRTNALLFLSGLALFILFILVCLWLAFRIYLRFDHAFRTIATTQIMVFLLGANVLAIVFRQRLFFRRFWLFWE